MSKPVAPSEADIIISRALLSYSQLKANVASWSRMPLNLSAANATPGEKGDEDDENDDDDDDDVLLVAESETTGVGYVAPKDSTGAPSKASNDHLRKLMLGKKRPRPRDAPHAGRTGAGAGVGALPSPPKPRKRAGAEDDDEDEEEGRSGALGKRSGRRQLNVAAVGIAAVESSAREDESGGTKRPATGGGRGGGGGASYLDEVLAQRAKKKHKKNKNTNQSTMKKNIEVEQVEK